MATLEFKSTNLTHGTFTSNTKSGDFTIYATSSKNVSTPNENVSLDGLSFSQGLNLGGAGAYNEYRAISFNVNSGDSITVYAKGATGRTLAFVNQYGTESSYDTTSVIAKYNFTAGQSGIYNLLSLKSGITIYYIKVETSGNTSTPINESTNTGNNNSSSNGKITLYKGSDNVGTYKSVKEAVAAIGSSGSYTVVIPKGTYNESYIYYNGSASITIRGETSSYNDTIIKGHGNNMKTEKGRELMELSGSCNVVLKNFTLESDYTRDVYGNGEVQSEVLGFDSNGTLAAYNCAFKSHQDTMRTIGKTWFYKCYISGDVDFIWTESKAIVALYEECELVSVYDKSAKNHETYVLAPRANVAGTLGKGVVLFKCKLTSESGQTSYLFRNPWGSNTSFYNQAAVIDCTFGGSGWHANAAKSAAMGTNDQQYIGWKMDSNVASKFSSKLSSIGTVSNSVKSSEYSNRNVILNRLVSTSGKFTDDSNKWDVDTLGKNNGFFGASSGTAETNTGNENNSGSTTNTSSFKASDKPIGFASIDAASNFGGYGKSEYTVSSASEFKKYAKAGNCVIYIKGTIDLSEGLLPSSAGGSTSALDSLVKSNSSYSSYSAFKEAYAKQCSTTTNDRESSTSGKSGMFSTLWTLHKAHANIVTVKLGSNLTIIGLGDAIIKGGCLIMNSCSNIAIRNVTIQDAYDPFPHHETSDGYNAEYDCLVANSTKNLWVDHCTLKDTLHCGTVNTAGKTSEKWQTYDGLFDVKGSSANITLSYCKIQDHDKTCLIGSSDTESFTGTRTITHCNNFYLNCGQRLPFVRMSNVHSFNNYFDCDENKYYEGGVCIQPRQKAQIIAESNYFGAGMRTAFKGDSKTKDIAGTKVYQSGNTFKCVQDKNKEYFTYVSSKPFTIPYTYKLETPSKNVGAN